MTTVGALPVVTGVVDRDDDGSDDDATGDDVVTGEVECDGDVTGDVECAGCDLTAAWGAGSGPGALGEEIGGAFCGDGSAL